MGSLLGVLALSALGLTYWSNVKEREHYLQSRNFRLLAVLASRTENLLANRARIFHDIVVGQTTQSGETSERWLETVTQRLREAGTNENGLNLSVPEVTANLSARQVRAGLVRSEMRASAHGSALRLEWPLSESPAAVLGLRIPADTALGALFESRVRQGAFDTVALATSDGTVVYAAGRRAGQLRATSLAAVVPSSTSEGGGGFGRYASTIADVDVRLAGAAYRMFMQPCCRFGSDAGHGLVVVGLADADALYVASLAISPVLVLGGVCFVLAAFAAGRSSRWPSWAHGSA
ncbi:MAG: hypothetical protein R2712_13495 [Vicinamibacterales bacterium]